MPVRLAIGHKAWCCWHSRPSGPWSRATVSLVDVKRAPGQNLCLWPRGCETVDMLKTKIVGFGLEFVAIIVKWMTLKACQTVPERSPKWLMRAWEMQRLHYIACFSNIGDPIHTVEVWLAEKRGEGSSSHHICDLYTCRLCKRENLHAVYMHHRDFSWFSTFTWSYHFLQPCCMLKESEGPRFCQNAKADFGGWLHPCCQRCAGKSLKPTLFPTDPWLSRRSQLFVWYLFMYVKMTGMSRTSKGHKDTKGISSK